MWKSALLVAVGAAGGGAAFAVASVPGSDGVIHACVELQQDGAPQFEMPNLKVIDPSRGQSCVTTSSPSGAPPPEANLSWNQQGLPGPTGSTGSTGPTGPRGKSVTIAGGNVITIRGTPITVGSSHSQTVITLPPLTRRSKSIGTLTLSLGGSTLTANIFSYSLATNTHGGGGGSGRSPVHEFVLTKKLDKASARLAQFCANGQHIPSGIIVVRKATKGPQKYLVIRLQTVLVSSYQTGSASKDTAPTESVSLNFSKIKIDYQPQKPDGT